MDPWVHNGSIFLHTNRLSAPPPPHTHTPAGTLFQLFPVLEVSPGKSVLPRTMGALPEGGAGGLRVGIAKKYGFSVVLKCIGNHN